MAASRGYRSPILVLVFLKVVNGDQWNSLYASLKTWLSLRLFSDLESEFSSLKLLMIEAGLVWTMAESVLW